jgi:hypothetical protein
VGLSLIGTSKSIPSLVLVAVVLRANHLKGSVIELAHLVATQPLTLVKSVFVLLIYNIGRGDAASS